jgi:hypothetical protein
MLRLARESLFFLFFLREGMYYPAPGEFLLNVA